MTTSASFVRQIVRQSWWRKSWRPEGLRYINLFPRRAVAAQFFWRRESGAMAPLPCFLEVLILKDFKSFAPEVLILVGLKYLRIRKMRGFCEILEVLILVDFKFTGINRSEKCGEIVLIANAGSSAERARSSE